MNASNECPECPRSEAHRGSYLVVMAFAVAAFGMWMSPGSPDDTSTAQQLCAAIDRIDANVGTFYDPRADVCSVWDGMGWRPVIVDPAPDKRVRATDKR